MIAISELKDWLAELPADGAVAVDDGGLTLVAFDADDNETGAYYEVGGIPNGDDNEEE